MQYLRRSRKSLIIPSPPGAKPGRGAYGQRKELRGCRHSGLIEGAAEGAGLGIRFLKHLERCRVLLHLIDIDPIDGSDPVENARIIIGELEKYSQDLASNRAGQCSTN
ncbi:hypothetical protein ACNKHK_20630 [Shigella flexneri]